MNLSGSILACLVDFFYHTTSWHILLPSEPSANTSVLPLNAQTKMASSSSSAADEVDENQTGLFADAPPSPHTMTYPKTTILMGSLTLWTADLNLGILTPGMCKQGRDLLRMALRCPQTRIQINPPRIQQKRRSPRKCHGRQMRNSPNRSSPKRRRRSVRASHALVYRLLCCAPSSHVVHLHVLNRSIFHLAHSNHPRTAPDLSLRLQRAFWGWLLCVQWSFTTML